ncbi:GyrI-like domain-containing protein [Derxia gummosa]|uniref:GyrI-like domain-containing protein n=1 Tax=Derxia gummosa DSM 723 TaxID=1121388 RepID=A0A8B6X1M0_9BURK|nr:GyrI-like domain-containing protein [Derxia gummosa]
METVPEVVRHPGFTAFGLAVRTSPDIEALPARARIGEVWRQFHLRALPFHLRANGENGRIVAVRHDFENGGIGAFTATVGVQLRRAYRLPDGLVEVRVSAGEYLRFSHRGQGALALARLWREATEFFKHPRHPLAFRFERAYTAEFECYGKADRSELYIAVKRKLGVPV